MPEPIKAVFDTSPLIFIDTLNYIQDLTKLYDIYLSPEVITELQVKPNKPGASIPSLVGITIQAPKSSTRQAIRQALSAGAGELSSIALATDLNCLVILDDQRPKRFAKTLQLNTVGTLGILLRLHSQNLNQRSFEADLKLLEESGMHLSEKLKQRVLERFNNPGQ